ncbi:cyclic nucleotide-binding domain-containing protein [Pseudenhygromyxa sp. WMMC2535]|nr:cyclic nucleotide-binding domain-containing protein [Pseudenhygromyxa sp. WMMC2535]
MSQDEIKTALQEIPLFAGLLPTHLDRIAKQAAEYEYAKSEYVFCHGDEGDGLYLVVSGAIRISRNVSGMGEEALAVLREGQHFGEMSLIDDDIPRSADAVCHEAARLLKLPKHDLRDLMFVDRELAYELLWRFVRGLSARLRDSNDRLMMLTATSKF